MTPYHSFPHSPWPLQEVQAVEPARGVGMGVPVQAGDTRRAHPLATTSSSPATTGAEGRVEKDGVRGPHAVPVQCAQGLHVQVLPGAHGGAALLLLAPRGVPSFGASGGECARGHALWDGRCPPPEAGATMRRWPRIGWAPGRGLAARCRTSTKWTGCCGRPRASSTASMQRP